MFPLSGKKNNNKTPKLTPTSQQKKPQTRRTCSCSPAEPLVLGWPWYPWCPGFLFHAMGSVGITKPAPVSEKDKAKGGMPRQGFPSECSCSAGRSLGACGTCVTCVTFLRLVAPRCCFPGGCLPRVCWNVGLPAAGSLILPVRNRLTMALGQLLAALREGERNVLGLGPAPCPHRFLSGLQHFPSPFVTWPGAVAAHPPWMSCCLSQPCCK